MTTATKNKDEILELLKAFKNKHQSEYHLLALGIFGSLARGEDRQNSDVDMVFETDKPNLFRTARMQQELQALLGRPVEVVRLREKMNPRLKQQILRDIQYV